MGLDIRLPIGLLFAVLGAILAAFGAFGDRSIYTRSLGYNVNLWWGLVLLGFGLLLLFLARRRSRHPERSEGSAGTNSHLSKIP